MQSIRIEIGRIPALVWGEPSDRAYLFVHGKSGSKADAETFAEIACRRGWQTLSVDLPQHGERQGGKTGFDPWHAVPELRSVLADMRGRWSRVALCAYSIGAWFSLLAFQREPLDRSLFVSPVLDMERLILDMMQWAGVSEERLMREKTVDTDFGETLSWEYLTFVRAHPIEAWNLPTAILYAGKDGLTSRATVDAFCQSFRCALTVMDGGEHWFHTPEQLGFLQKWMEENVCGSIM